MINFKREFTVFFLIGLGSIPGALIRWQFNNDFLTNSIGCLLLGFLIGKSYNFRAELLLGVGFCGSLTTFSGWIVRFLKLIITGYYLQALGIIIFTLLVSLLAGIIGFYIARQIK